jgi:hypothetical protein
MFGKLSLLACLAGATVHGVTVHSETVRGSRGL